MPELTNYRTTSISKLLDNLSFYKFNPGAMQQLILEHWGEISDNEINIVDPTNPLILLLETSTVNTSLAISEMNKSMRSLYPSLAQTDDDLYLHMSDNDFISRFSTPSNAEFTFAIRKEDIDTKLIYDEDEKCYKTIIPRNTEVIVNEITFTSSYPIVIRKYLSGMVLISFDNSLISPLETLKSNIIDYTVRRSIDKVDWVFFKVNLSQFKINTSYFNIQKSIILNKSLEYSDKYYYTRVYYRNNSNWVEIKTTHTEQVYDPYTPTAVIKVNSDTVDIFIPPVYVNTDLISGELRVDIYTTKGEISINLNNYKLDAYTMQMSSLDKENNINDYTNAFLNLTYTIYCDQLINGGKNGISFEELRSQIINNSIGDRSLPITNIQLISYINNLGYDVVTNIDVLTNRIFLAIKKLPKPSSSNLLTSANIGISTLLTNLFELKTHYKVIDNVDRLTLLSNSLFSNDNSKLSLLSETEVNNILALTKLNLMQLVNTSYYAYNPYYYVLDSSKSEFELRAYHLDQPKAKDINFKQQNETIQLPVNTYSYELEKVTTGYKLTIVTKSGNFYKQLADSLVSAQIAFYPKNETKLVYINGILLNKTTTGERIYEFYINSNHDIDSDNCLCVTNSKMLNNDDILAYINLESIFKIFYTTSSLTDSFIPDETDSLIGKFLLPEGSVAITHEELTLVLGYSLKNLWTKSRTLAAGLDYEIHTVDVPLTYTKDIYEVDPSTGSIFSFDGNGDLVYNKIHSLGDPVLDTNNNQVYKNRIGDVVLDNNGKPVISSGISTSKEIDILLVDGKYYFVNDLLYNDYKKELASVISTWVTDDLIDMQDILLEQSKIFFYPKSNLGLVKIYVDSNTEDYIQAEQSFKLDLYVNNRIYRDSELRQQLILGTIKIIDSFIDKEIVNMSEITEALRTFYYNNVVSFDISNINNKYKIIKVLSQENRLCIKKKLELQSNDNFIITEDINIEFHNIEQI